MDFKGVWFECAGGSIIKDGEITNPTPPSCADIDQFILNKLSDKQVQYDIRHRFILTKRNFKSFSNWAKSQFFFRNATKEQILKFEDVVFPNN